MSQLSNQSGMYGSLGWRQLRREEANQRTHRRVWTRSLKLFFLAAPTLMIIAVVWYLQRPVSMEVTEELPKSASAHPAELATQIHLEQFDGQRTQWTLDAPVARQEEAETILVMKPRLSIFRKNGEQVNVTAKQGTVNKQTRMMRFEGSVRAEGDRQFGLLTTEQLQFDPKEGILSTEESFFLKNRSTQLRGVGLKLIQETKTVQVLKRVEMIFFDGVPTLTGEQDSL
ncbi:MAG: LPS export ABC transporter periplasmic protein LptC [Magnetococcales bacterium]|nr:LPS export ABC transporter periplasmic protein LptC [Magnetococcales bacterium]